MNRFASILEGTAGRVIEDIAALKVPNAGHWHVCNGQLCVSANTEHFAYTFDANDAESQAMILLLNNMHYLQAAVGGKP